MILNRYLNVFVLDFMYVCTVMLCLHVCMDGFICVNVLYSVRSLHHFILKNFLEKEIKFLQNVHWSVVEYCFYLISFGFYEWNMHDANDLTWWNSWSFTYTWFLDLSFRCTWGFSYAVHSYNFIRSFSIFSSLLSYLFVMFVCFVSSFCFYCTCIFCIFHTFSVF